MCPVCGLLMHTSVLALRVCWGTYLASKGSGTRSSLVHFVIKEASDAGERPGLLMAAHFAMKEASDTDERVELLVAAAAALNLHGYASPSVSSREARARARTFVEMHMFTSSVALYRECFKTRAPTQ